MSLILPQIPLQLPLAHPADIRLPLLTLRLDEPLVDVLPEGIAHHGVLLQHLERLVRSEEHTSELQSQSNLVCRLLLEKKKKNKCIRGRHRHSKDTNRSTVPTWKKSTRTRRSSDECCTTTPNVRRDGGRACPFNPGRCQ